MTSTERVVRAIRIAVVDDHALFRAGLRLILEREPDMACVGEASDVEGALAIVRAARPDLLLLDLRLASARGTDVLARLAQVTEGPRVLVLTAYPEERDIAEALRLGAKGVVLKESTRETMLEAIRAVSAGGVWLPPDLGAKVIASLAEPPTAHVAERLGQLTPRERDIVALIGLGLKNREIASRLSVAEKTVKGHLTSVFVKLGVQDRLELALLAVKLQLVPPRS